MLNRFIGPLLFLAFAWFVVSNADARTIIAGVAIFLIGIIVFISLQVSNLRFPKPTKKTALFIPCVILVALFVYLEKRNAAYVAVIMLALGLLYVALGPLFVKRVEIHKARRDCAESDL